MILVIMRNGRKAEVTPEALDGLIEKSAIVSFEREGRWAVLGRDPLRSRRSPTLCIPERRSRAAESFDRYLQTLAS